MKETLYLIAGNAGQDAGADKAAELHQPSEPELVPKSSLSLSPPPVSTAPKPHTHAKLIGP